MRYESIIKAGIFGTVVADALGVPVEFSMREERVADPVVDMREYGTHNQPRGTWSDDSSMILATLDSMVINGGSGFDDNAKDSKVLGGGIRFDDIMERFRAWLTRGEYTPYGRVFDRGITCSNAIGSYRAGCDPLDCGRRGVHDNGNGSLMRIMPVSLYAVLNERRPGAGCDVRPDENFWNADILSDAVLLSHNISRLTHAHPRSQMACAIYTAICHELIFRDKRSVNDAVQSAIGRIMDFYDQADDSLPWFDPEFEKEIKADAYGRMRDVDKFAALPVSEIRSSGYVVDTLEAAIYCLLTTDSYKACTLKAVNLGSDTDTVGAVAGGLAGLAYGYGDIPKEWLEVIASRKWIDELCVKFAKVLEEL